ncbi:hypothetical protein CgunFtcFv8_004926 [Champsocephalus gunnari]|uniref:Uncharacterized protein n=1 Tax=Champsocephalus gunnari TaxID=52237 RepID=A0AAN8HCY4_CHAGU|nr:hypothetical protein CgunFtcFv8_004926 [Champsocephalus gunnari]
MEAGCQRANQPERATTIPERGENTGQGQVRRPSLKRAECDNSVVTMLICTSPTATSVQTPVSHHAPKGTICPF